MILKINDRIRTREVTFFDDIQLQLKYDTVASTFAVKCYYNPKNEQLKDLLCIGHYHICTIEHNGKTIFTGNVLAQKFKDAAKEKSFVELSGASLPGILEDCNISTSLQSTGLTLRNIIDKLVKPFGVNVVYDKTVLADVSIPYDDVIAKPTQSVKEYISQLASQKNITASHDANGNLVMRRATPFRNPVASFGPGMRNMEMEVSFNGQGMHSTITVMTDADFDNEVQATASPPLRNPYVIGTVFRPRVSIMNATSAKSGGDTEKAAFNLRAQELKNLSLVINLEGWDVDGRVIMPGDIISVDNPQVYLFRKANWFVDQIDFSGSTDNKTSVLRCVLPAVYDGSNPEYLFSGINLH